MKNIKKILALALVVVSILAITVPAMAVTGTVDSSFGPTPKGTVNYYSGYTTTVSTTGLTKIGEYSHGKSINVTGVNSHWYKFTIGSSTRYILRQFVRISGLEYEIRYGTMELNLGCSWTRYVKQLQTDLTNLGYDTKGIDGAFGANTEDAVIAFQEANGLDADGRVGPRTKMELYYAIVE